MKKKVLFLIHTLSAGGAEKILVNLANGIDKEKYDITVMTVIDTGVFRKDLNDDIEYKSIFKNPFSSKKPKKQVKPGNPLNKKNKLIKLLAKFYVMFWKVVPMKLVHKLFIGNKYDTEIAFLEGICAKIISGSSNERSEKISWIHVDMMNHNKSEAVFWNRDLEMQCYDKFSKIICVSNNVKSSFIEKFPINEEKILVRYNPVDTNEILHKAKEDVLDVEISDKKIVCSVGRLVTQKGYDRLLRVHNTLIKEGLDYELWIIGEGNKRKELEDYIENNNLRNSVKLIGFKENPYKYISKSDIFVCSSRAEGFSTVATEATILGKPIVTVNCSGMKELLGESNELGIVTENNEDALCEGLKNMIEDESLIDKYKKALENQENRFNYKQAVREIERLC